MDAVTEAIRRTQRRVSDEEAQNKIYGISYLSRTVNGENRV